MGKKIRPEIVGRIFLAAAEIAFLATNRGRAGAAHARTGMAVISVAFDVGRAFFSVASVGISFFKRRSVSSGRRKTVFLRVILARPAIVKTGFRYVA